MHLDLIHQTFKDLAQLQKAPVFVLIFMGESVKLISKTGEGYSPEVAQAVSAMAKDGIKLEICLVAAQVFNVDPASVLPEIKKVKNGWLSEIGYESQGYSLVPA